MHPFLHVIRRTAREFRQQMLENEQRIDQGRLARSVLTVHAQDAAAGIPVATLRQVNRAVTHVLELPKDDASQSNSFHIDSPF